MHLITIVTFVLLSAKVQSSYPTSSNMDINEHRGSHCVWSQWGYWSECSTDCGTGTQTRRRQCECGLLAGTCEGDAVETRKCESSHSCDESVCRFGDWSEWSQCSDTCDGLRYRKQMCQCGLKIFNDSHCKGLPLEDTEVCNSESSTSGCCHWEWINNWSNANTTCCPSDGIAWRRQACMCAERGLSSDSYCAKRGPFEQESAPCVNQSNCHGKPTTPSTVCHWTDKWSAWSSCSVNRGEGVRYRSKKCSCGDPQLCPYPAPIDTATCQANPDDVTVQGVWVENNVTTQCDKPCGVGAYWIGATCLCGDSYCDISHCWGIPHTRHQVCMGQDCPSSCVWEVTLSGCEEEEDEWLIDMEEEEERDEYERLYDQQTTQSIQELDEIEKKFLEEKKHLMMQHRTQVIARRCLCSGVEVNSEHCSPALEVYEEKPCHQGETSECVWLQWSPWTDCSEELKQSRTRLCSCENQHSCKGSNVEERRCLEKDNVSSSTQLQSSSVGSQIPVLLVLTMLVIVLVFILVVVGFIQRLNNNRKTKQLVLIY
eukprot:TRINITY_DN284_c3_g1_i1.p1 TRINITY_DN284_c3_g1~~TRINITY_DN284_c3_g1_i1.p1  ORF type:complete len:541 (-),score=74.38 TRINITY_DN284_c3_g1_i1:100-1722(-)